MPFRLSYARTCSAEITTAFDRVLPCGLPELFAHRSWLIPPIAEVREQQGVWQTPGQTRTIVMADRGTMHETLLGVDRPESFDYQVVPVTGPMRLLIREAHGRWSFESAGTGVRITWTWDVDPRGRLGAYAERPLRAMWTGYARLAFDEIESLIAG